MHSTTARPNASLLGNLSYALLHPLHLHALKRNLCGLATILLVCLPALACHAASQHFYLDSKTGNDANDGLTPQTAWKTLQKASGRNYTEGE